MALVHAFCPIADELEVGSGALVGCPAKDIDCHAKCDPV